MLGGIGPTELLIVLAIVVVLFGASRISGIGGAVGGAIREFRKEMKEPEDEKSSATVQSQAKTEEPRRKRRPPARTRKTVPPSTIKALSRQVT